MESYYKQTVYFPNNRKRTFEIKAYSKDGNAKSVMEYIKPARVKGDKFLFLKGGDIWAYFSKTGRIRRIASSAKKSKMQGSDFSYEDMSMMSSLDTDFKIKLSGNADFEGSDCFVLQLIPVKSISYNKLIVLVDKDKFVIRKITFFKNNKPVKYMVQKDFKKIKNYLIPYTIKMQSIIKNSKTVIKTLKVKVDIKISDKKFKKNYLSR